MSKSVKILTALFILSLLFIGHTYLRHNNTLYNFFFSPNDLYKPLYESEFDLSDKNLQKEFTITHKYPGNHWIVVMVEKPLIESTLHYDSNFKVQITFLRGNTVLFGRIVSDTKFCFYGKADRSGFSLLNYDTPSMLPIGAPLTVKCKIIEASPAFTMKYGKQRLILSKFSDE